MNDLWNEEEWKAISGLKRHLEKPCVANISRLTCCAVQQLMHQMKKDISLTELWDLPQCRWVEFSKQASFWSSTVNPVWEWELVQTLFHIFAGKRIGFSNQLVLVLHKYMFHIAGDGKTPYLPQPFPGHPLKELAMEGNAIQCKLYLDLANNPEKKRQSVLQIMLNQGHFQAAADLHKLCGGGLEHIDRTMLFHVWSNTAREKISGDFDRIVMPLLMPRDLLLDQHPTGKWDKRMRPALESGCADGNTVIFEEGTCKMTLGRYMHFLHEIREELLSLNIGDKLKSDVMASESFIEWEKKGSESAGTEPV